MVSECGKRSFYGKAEGLGHTKLSELLPVDFRRLNVPLPSITEIANPLASEEEEFVDGEGQKHKLQLVLGHPQVFGTMAQGDMWCCPCAIGIDGVFQFNRFGGPGRVAAVINACKFLEARRYELVDEPAFKRLGITNSR